MSAVNVEKLPHGRLFCKTCGTQFFWERELVKHILEVRALEVLNADHEQAPAQLDEPGGQ